MIQLPAGLLLLALACAYAAEPCGAPADPRTMLVTTGWLAAHLSDPHLAIVAIGDRADYDRGHIPGAVFLRYADMSAKQSVLTLELPPMNNLAAIFGGLGVSNDSRIVLYINGGRPIQATRVFLTLDAMGLGAQASILDGGMPLWEQEGHPVSRDVPAVKQAALTPCPRSDVIVDNSYVASHLRHGGVDIVDARAPEYYSGENTAPGKRRGHIPGALNLPYTAFVDPQGKLYPPDTLREMFRRAGIQPGDRVVSYCHIGMQATMVYFAARYLGFDARLYDGSWEDWSAHLDLPAETAAH